jgi:hypothetical protein
MFFFYAAHLRGGARIFRGASLGEIIQIIASPLFNMSLPSIVIGSCYPR